MKPVLLVYGDCQSLELYRAACRIPAVTEHFDVHMIDRAWSTSQVLALPPDDICERCTIFWRQIGGDRFGEAALDRFSTVRTITFAPIYFGGLWPYVQSDPLFPPEPENDHHQGFFTYQDRFLASVAASPLPVEAAVRCYHDMVSRPEEAIDRALEGSLKLMASREAATMVPIAAYIFAWFRRHRLFWTSGHPSAALMGVLLDRLLAATWPDLFRHGRPHHGAGWRACHECDSLAYDQWMVHPAVGRALGLDWWRPDTAYLQRPDRWFPVDAYIAAYVEERRLRQANGQMRAASVA